MVAKIISSVNVLCTCYIKADDLLLFKVHSFANHSMHKALSKGKHTCETYLYIDNCLLLRQKLHMKICVSAMWCVWEGNLFHRKWGGLAMFKGHDSADEVWNMNRGQYYRSCGKGRGRTFLKKQLGGSETKKLFWWVLNSLVYVQDRV